MSGDRSDQQAPVNIDKQQQQEPHGFCGIHPRKRERGLTQQLKDYSGVGLKPGKRWLKGPGNSSFKCKHFQAVLVGLVRFRVQTRLSKPECPNEP